MDDTAKSTRARDRRWLWLGLFVVPAIALDQVTKHIAESTLAHRPLPMVIVPRFFMLFYSRNPGAFFNLGEHLPDSIRVAVLVGAMLVAMGFIIQLYRRSRAAQRIFRAALLCFLAGAVGNLIDRVVAGEVVDFMHLHYEDYFHWATFNVADCYIVAGVVLLLVDAIRGYSRAAAPKETVEQS